MQKVLSKDGIGLGDTNTTTSKPLTAISQRAANVSFAAAAIFLLLLAALHVIKPVFDPSWRFVSEYAIGRHGWIMVLAFLFLALSCLASVIAIRSQIETTGGKIGLVLLHKAIASMDSPSNLDQRFGDVRVYVHYARANSRQIRSQSVNWMAQPACGFSLLRLANGRRLARD